MHKLLADLEGVMYKHSMLERNSTTVLVVVKLLHQSEEINSELTRAIEAIANLASIIEDRENTINTMFD